MILTCAHCRRDAPGWVVFCGDEWPPQATGQERSRTWYTATARGSGNNTRRAASSGKWRRHKLLQTLEEEEMVHVSWKIILVTALVPFAGIGLLSPFVAVLAQTTGEQDNKTAWESYKNRSSSQSVDQHLTDPALVGAVDLHAHSDPDSYPRQWDGFDVAKLAKDRGMRGVLLKNHWTETAGLAYLVRKYGPRDIEVFGGLSLDTPVGGINPQAVRYMVDVIGHYGRIVWMPTHDSEHEVKYLKENRAFVGVSRDGKLLPEVIEMLSLIAQSDLTLATGHVTPDEALMIFREAKDRGVQRMIVTHPLLGPQYTYMSTDQLAEAASLGAYIEITAGTVSRDTPARIRAFEAIREVGPAMTFISSDSGLTGGLNHSDALAMAAKALREGGFSERDLTLMFKENPARLVKLPVSPE